MQKRYRSIIFTSASRSTTIKQAQITAQRKSNNIQIKEEVIHKSILNWKHIQLMTYDEMHDTLKTKPK